MGRPLNAAPTVAIVFDRKHVSTNRFCAKPKTGLVQIVVTYLGRHKTISTGVKVYRDEWRDGAMVVQRGDAMTLNKTIMSVYDYVNRKISLDVESGGVSIERLEVKSDLSFYDYAIGVIESMDIRDSTKKSYRTKMSSVLEFGKWKTLNDVTRESLNEYIAWKRNHKLLRSFACVRGKSLDVLEEPVKDCTVKGSVSLIVKVLKVAVEEGLISQSVVNGVKFKAKKSEERAYLNKQQIDDLIALELSGQYDVARLMFLLQCGTGLAFTDFEHYRWDKVQKKETADGGFIYVITGKRQKTGSYYYSVALPFAMDALWQLENNPVRMSYDVYRGYLKKISKIMGLDFRITSHVGRHTFATYCLSSGVRIEVVQKMLGHQDINQTQIYAKLVNKAVEDEMVSLARL